MYINNKSEVHNKDIPFDYFENLRLLLPRVRSNLSSEMTDLQCQNLS
jgi:hypothetical protein